MFRSIDKFKSIPDSLCFCWFKSFIKSAWTVSFIIIHDQSDFLGFGIPFIRNSFYKGCPVNFCFLLLYIYESFSFQGLIRHKNIAHSMANVIVVNFGGLSRFHFNTSMGFCDKLFWRFIHTDNWIRLVIRPFINIQYFLHVGNKLGVSFWRNNPSFYLPGT